MRRNKINDNHILVFLPAPVKALIEIETIFTMAIDKKK
jgi:hypothetical protein